MTIEERINRELDQLVKDNGALADIARNLNRKVNELIGDVTDHLGEISQEMPEYDKHDASHSEAVLRIIEELLRDEGIQNLSLLEAIILRFCCYFHDTGMILPKFCMQLLVGVEADPKADPVTGLEEWLIAQEKDFDQVKELFLLPGSQDGYIDFLIQELEDYQEYRLGLNPAPDGMELSDYVIATRHEYLRKNHGSRSRKYATNLSRRFEDVIYGSERDFVDAIGDICAAHNWAYQQVRNLPTKLELFSSCPELTCNVRYIAMLLRMGDLLHFGPERASSTLYIERQKMNTESDLHWRAKRDTRGYRITPAEGGVDISYHGSFSVPQEYYFVHEHMNWVDEELICYETFRRDMEKQFGDNRYDLGLPEKVNRSHTTARDFTPDQDLKFKLEHQNIIELLMGARLYRDEFMCLRELYQNALDACRCMRAENEQNGLSGDLEIEFGLGRDDSGDYLYCKDQGTGMTMDIVKNYLLRIGNSYYKSAEFRRANASWGNAVVPVSEFAIGLLSCYMIAHRIEVITRHYSKTDKNALWISMEGSDDYGYLRSTTRLQERQLGSHGTIVKLYLLEKYKPMVTNLIPENPDDVVFIQRHCRDNKDLDLICNSLYARIRRFIYIPENGVRIFVKAGAQRIQLSRLDGCYGLTEKLPMLISHGITPATFIGHHIPDDRKLFGKRINNGESPSFVEDLVKWRKCFDYLPCIAEDRESRTIAVAYIHLPSNPDIEYTTDIIDSMDVTEFGFSEGVFIDGMPVFYKDTNEPKRFDGIVYQFLGAVRPKLTVDRGEIRSIPQNVLALQRKLNSQLQSKVVEQICDHFSRYPSALTKSAKNYLIKYWC